MTKLNLLTILLTFLATITVLADNSPYDFKITSSPFKTCSGTGDSVYSVYANQNLTINLSPTSIQLVDSKKQSEIYASAKSLCGIDISERDVVCDVQTESLSGTVYELKKSCSSLIPGTNRSDFIFRLDLVINIKDVSSVKTGFGNLICVANENGFRSLAISSCK